MKKSTVLSLPHHLAFLGEVTEDEFCQLVSEGAIAELEDIFTTFNFLPNL
jgi:hypothetical protein